MDMKPMTSQSCSLKFNETDYKNHFEKCNEDKIESTKCVKKNCSDIRTEKMFADDTHHHHHIILEDQNNEFPSLRQQLEAHLSTAVIQQDSLMSDINDSKNPEPSIKLEFDNSTSQRLNMIGILVNRQIRKIAMSEAKSTIIQEQLISTQDHISKMEEKLSMLSNSDTKTKQMEKQLTVLDILSKQMLDKFSEIDRASTQFRDQLSTHLEIDSKEMKEEMNKKLSKNKEDIVSVEKRLSESLSILKNIENNQTTMDNKNFLIQDRMAQMENISKQTSQKLLEIERNSSQSREQLSTQIENNYKKTEDEINVKLSQTKGEIQSAKDRFAADTDNRIKNIESIQASTGHKLSETQNQLTHINNISNHIQQRMGNIENLFNGINNELASLKNELATSSNRSGTFVWKITGWGGKMNDAKSGRITELHSSEFYSNYYGYKLKVTMAPNGLGDANGTHVSLVVQFVPGEYDGILSWPFIHTIRYFVLNQEISNIFLTEEISLTVLPTNLPGEFWKKPDKTPNTGYQSNRFASHTELYNEKYIRDDNVFLNVVIDSFTGFLG